MMPQKQISFTCKRRAVNNKLIAADIENVATDLIYAVGEHWTDERSRGRCVDMLDEHMQNLYDQDLIEQYNVICDQRNNSSTEKQKGIFNLLIQYKQRNCVNTSRMEFQIRMSNDKENENNDVI